MNNPKPGEPKRIAVIAVHGVGDQQPLESARAIGDLLQNIDIGVTLSDAEPDPCAPPAAVNPRYDPFTERTVRINVRPVVVRAPEGARAFEPGLRGPFHHWARTVREARAAGPQTSRVDDEEIAFRFMWGQLRCYHGEGPEETFETVRLEGKRTAHDAEGERIVHVYEAYWADLSRLKSGVFSIFTELYQLLLHLSSLGTHVVDAESLHHDHVSWTRLSRWQSAASVCLTVPIPIINLLMLGVTFVTAGLLALRRLSPAIQVETVVAVAAGGAIFGWGFMQWRGQIRSVGRWLMPPFVWAAIASTLWFYLSRRCVDPWDVAPVQCQPLLNWSRVGGSAILAVVAALLVTRLVRAYDRRRPRAQIWYVWLAALLLATGSATVWYTGPPGFSNTLFYWFRLLEVLYVAVIVAWAVFFLLAIGAYFAGTLAMRHLSDQRERDRANRSRWTGRLMLGLPAFFFAVITLAGWALIEIGLSGYVDNVPYVPLIPKFYAWTASQLLDNLQAYGGGSALSVLLAAGGAAALPALWGMAPVVLSEVWPPDFRKARRGDYARRLGEWLTITFRGLRLSGQIMYGTMIFVVPVFVGALLLARAVAPIELDRGAGTRSHHLFATFTVLGSISAAVFAWLFAARGQLKKAALGFRTGLDILLDVDNWLREHPLQGNPKARICGRYVSLLRYICTWKDPLSAQGCGYDAIVIVAHSQGTVVTADLLRFLHREAGTTWQEYDPPLAALEKMGVKIFTMGCPLRDLYGLRFPRLYAWARHNDTAPMADWIEDDLVHGRGDGFSPLPDPRKLGVGLWVNAYRSGDYIGRFLWRTTPCGYLWSGDLGGLPFNQLAKHVSSDGTMRMEFCIGAGAHTHYWDRTAPMIAMELDRLIATSSAGAHVTGV